MTRNQPALHGTRSMYVNGCRCVACRKAHAVYVKEWRARRRAAGTHRLLHGRWIKWIGGSS